MRPLAMVSICLFPTWQRIKGSSDCGDCQEGCVECLQTLGIIYISLWCQGCLPWVLAISSHHAPPLLPVSVPLYGDHKFLCGVLSWHNLPVGCSGILTRVLLTLFWIACHQRGHSSWPSVSGIKLHSCLMATPPRLGNSYRGSSSLVSALLRP